ncbi:MAG: hypothetical protein L0Z50_26805 [Verrucomicrobiales bacterium]|nr:hypothetical protein [Verrucomicrobiales bacterium]
MWVDFDILKAHGSTNERLREIFEIRKMERPGDGATEKDWQAYKDWQADEDVRKEFEEEIMGRLEEGIRFSLKNYKAYAAVDLAWDTSVLIKERLPLLLYAQGRIEIQQCVKDLSALGCADAFVKKDTNGKVTGIDMPKFIDVSFNIVRSFITRRLATQSNKYLNLWPYYRYEPRGTDTVSKLRGDVMSQEAEIIVDGYGYRQHEPQVWRDALKFGHSVDFVRAAWEWDQQCRKVNLAPQYQADQDKPEYETAIVREGLSWTNPHPSRVFADNSEPLASINCDNGPQFIAYWDVVRWDTVQNNPKYWNRTSVSYGPSFWDLFAAYPGFTTQYLCNVTPPPSDTTLTSLVTDIAGQNDRKNNLGFYSPNQKDVACVKAEYFRKLTPKQHRMGDYPHEVWVRFVTVSDCRIIYAQFLPSSPAAVCSLNEDDSRQMNVSFGMGLLTYQDMMSNLITQMLLGVQAELFKIIGVNTDALSAEQIAYVRKRMQGADWATDPLVIEYSLKALEDMGLKPDAVFKIGETRQGQSITLAFQAMVQLLGLIERLEFMSPNEQAQAAPREISATETAEIAGTTTAVNTFFSDSIDEYRGAKKRIVYESMLSCKKRRVQVPVVNRYSRKTVTAAGFQVQDGEGQNPAEMIKDRYVIGTVRALEHDYIFSSRDGSERPVNTQAANTLVQLLQVVLQVPIIVQGLGREKIYDMFNEVFRMAGAGVDLKLEMQEGDDSGFGADQLEQLSQVMQQLQAALQKVAQQTEQNATELTEQAAVNERQEQMLQATGQLAKQVEKAVNDIAKIMTRQDALDAKAKEVPEIPYRDAPENIRRQIEEEAGYKTEASPEYLEMELAKQKDTKKSVVGQI